MFDAVASILMPQQAQKLAGDVACVQWFLDAYAHCKTIAHCEGTKIILERAGIEPDEGVVPLEALVKTGVHRHWASRKCATRL
jgi:catalase